MTDDFSLTLGVEEEFFLIEPRSRNLLADPDPEILAEAISNRGAHNIVPEFLRSQLETNTRVCESVGDARAALCETRGVVLAAANRRGAQVMAASTHPFAEWRAQRVTSKDRYRRFEISMQEIVRRFLVGGMHIHAGFGTADERVRVMTALRRYLPLFNALSGSSPLNANCETGYKSYRPTIIGTLPRTGVPDELHSRAEYDALVDSFRRLKMIENGSELWWEIRPAQQYPTIELRCCDICPRLEDAMCVIALYASLIRYLLRRVRAGDLPPEPPTPIIAENLWLAQRYGTFAFFGDAERGERVDIEDCVKDLVTQLRDDARALNCESEIRRALHIVREGASADRQIDHYRLRRVEGDDHAQALRAVVDLVLAETREGVAADREN